MDWFFSALAFLTSGIGILATLALAGLMVVAWDWRLALIGLAGIQVSLAAFAVEVHDVSPQWAFTHVLITALCALVLAISAIEVRSSRSLHQPGNWLLRLLGLILVFVGWRLVNIQVVLPAFPANQVTYLIAIMLCALLMLSFGDNPLFTGVALLLWIMPLQILVDVLLPVSTLVAFMGVLQLLLALTCSFLVAADRLPLARTRPIETDITFPDVMGATVATEDEGGIDVSPLTNGADRMTDPVANGSARALTSGARLSAGGER